MKAHSELFKKLQEEFGLSKVVLEVIVRHQFKYTKKEMQKPDLTGILLHNLGTFRARRGRVDFLLKKMLWRMRKKSGDQDALKEKFQYLWAIRHTTYR